MSRHVLPHQPAEDLPNSCTVNPVSNSEGRLAIRTSANFPNVVLRQLGVVTLRPTPPVNRQRFRRRRHSPPPLPALQPHIGHVVSVGPEKEVVRVNATANVAGVENHCVGRDWPPEYCPGEPMRAGESSRNTSLAVPRLQDPTGPDPAAGSLLDASEEPVHNRDLKPVAPVAFGRAKSSRLRSPFQFDERAAAAFARPKQLLRHMRLRRDGTRVVMPC